MRWLVGYTYLGEQRASVMGVTDSQYDSQSHQIINYAGERYSPFHECGQIQGAPQALYAGYAYGGRRFGAEAGAWVYRQTRHRSLYNLDNQPQGSLAQDFRPVGTSFERGPFSLPYRYYGSKADWNPYPGLATGAHLLTLNYRFKCAWACQPAIGRHVP